MQKKVWICTKCYSIPNELTKTIIKIIKLQNPSFIGVVPDPPDKKRGITDRLQFDVDSEYWGLNLLAEIEEREARDLVPYSLRHFMITQRIMSGLNFKQIADMCGTSVMQIERTYYHLNDEIRLTNALADYKRNDDGTIEPI